MNGRRVIDRGTEGSIEGGERLKLGHPSVQTIHLSAGLKERKKEEDKEEEESEKRQKRKHVPGL